MTSLELTVLVVCTLAAIVAFALALIAGVHDSLDERTGQIRRATGGRDAAGRRAP